VREATAEEFRSTGNFLAEKDFRVQSESGNDLVDTMNEMKQPRRRFAIDTAFVRRRFANLSRE
jgi:hypothetical protein